MDSVAIAGLHVARPLHHFLETEALPGTGIAPAAFWPGLAALLRAHAPGNAALLARRDALQAELDTYFAARTGRPIDPADQEAFLRRIGYLAPMPDPFTIDPANVDPEIARIAGPQLVVPLSNARYALNAANARWGSLIDALTQSDALGPVSETERRPAAWARAHALLDRAAPLAGGSHAQATGYAIEDGTLRARLPGGDTGLATPEALIGWRGDPARPDAILFRHHGLHLELHRDPADLVLESAVTTIMDLEDSVAAVDAEDKLALYRTWLGLVRGTLAVDITRGGRIERRELAPDRDWQTATGPLTLPGRSLMLVRHVGHHMLTDMVRDENGSDMPETIIDAVVTGIVALHELRGSPRLRNTRTGSAYFVKPKLHGPEEAAFANALFDAVEDLLSLPRHLLKIGVMDEERRTSANLGACIAATRHRIVFINTGFLDRTGDEIHSVMEAGPVLRRAALQRATWLAAYEAGNVATGLATGFAGRAQIGKGMWAEPDRMNAMLQSKGAQMVAGASTAWVPSPTAATLHALHYHETDVAARQAALADTPPPPLSQLLTPPLEPRPLDPESIQNELDLNAHGILGYVARWVDQGIGASKLTDLHGVALMEDRATLRIASQILANWLRHGVITAEQIDTSLRRMAERIDADNARDPNHRALAGNSGSLAFEAARALILEGASRPNGYTETVLHPARRAAKTRDA